LKRVRMIFQTAVKMKLKTSRIILSIFLFSLFILLFWGGEHIAGRLSKPLLFFQFIPSVIKFFSIGGFITTGFIFIIVITLFFGRIYCSFLCPLGMLSDFFIFLSRKLNIRKNHVPQKPHPIIQNSFLLFTLFSAGLGSFAILNMLDPYSIFGRTAAHLFYPVFALFNNGLLSVFETFDCFILYVKRPYPVSFSTQISAGISFFIFFILALFYGRAYCNTICPVGTVLGYLSKYSMFRFFIDPDKCSTCGLCSTVCKSGCINVNEQAIEQSRCVACFNCLNACKQSAVSFSSYPPLKHSSPQLSKRSFIFNSIYSTLGISVFLIPFFSPFRLIQKKTPVSRLAPVIPPGSLNLAHFSQTCTACHLCVSTCPTGVLTPSFAAYGPKGLLQPKMDYIKSFCDFECNTCGKVCPSGSILPLTLAQKKRTQIGKVVLVKNECIVHTKKRHCGACGEVCPTRAIYPVEKGRILFPEINTDFCIGCGACEKACPVNPKAIFVTANTDHGLAQKYIPKERPLTKIKANGNKAFPF
jgi:ferredoxin